jgi:hypothetical protein
MSNPLITYTPRPDVSSEGELNALTTVYRFILNCHAKKNAAGVTSTNGDDAMKGSLTHEDRANPDYTGT